MRNILLVLPPLLAAFASCARAPEPSALQVAELPVLGAVTSAPPAIAKGAPAPAPQAPVPALGYPWVADLPAPVPGGTLDERFSSPAGFTRVELSPRSFGAWLRALPLAPPGTPVRSFRGSVVLPADHPSLAAVVALDVGDGDVQQCADSVIRLHAEWLFAQGRRDASYRAASGAAMPFARWARGERMVPEGMGFTWSTSARADAGHASYRRWLSAVFAFANTGSLARDTEPVAAGDLCPGDFVVQPGAPGHAVLVLDVARPTMRALPPNSRAPDGRRALLLGQGYMPAQSFHVLRPAGGGAELGAWFVVEPGATALDTPFWAPFPWKTLHRFPGT